MTVFPSAARITIADNGSTDGTWPQALALAAELPAVRAVRLERPGRGGALRSIWSASDADVLAYMDVDLSTDLNALLPLLAPLLSGHSDVAIGTRLARGARVIRGPRREIISRCYNLLLHATLGTGFSDAQCGFKAIRADARAGYCCRSPRTPAGSSTPSCSCWPSGPGCASTRCRWTGSTTPTPGSPSSATALADLRGIVRLGTGLARGTIRVPRAARPARRVCAARDDRPVRAGWPASWPVRRGRGGQHRGLRAAVPAAARVLAAQAANALSLLITAVANTAANRRLTFGIRGRAHAARHQLRGLIAFGIGLAVTSGALAALHAVAAQPGPRRRGRRARRGEPGRHRWSGSPSTASWVFRQRARPGHPRHRPELPR